MELERVAVTSDFVASFSGVLQRHRLLPDEWRDHPWLALRAIEESEFYLLKAGRRTLGLAWIRDIVPGHSCDVCMILEKKYRDYMSRKGPKKYKGGKATLGKLRLRYDLLTRCFDELGVRRVGLRVPDARRSAKRMAHAFGFDREGRERNAFSYEGKPQDAIIYSMTKQDWYGHA